VQPELTYIRTGKLEASLDNYTASEKWQKYGQSGTFCGNAVYMSFRINTTIGTNAL